MPLFLQRLAAGAEDQKTIGERILVIVQLDGGNDGLNTIIPYRDPAYVQHRPRLRLPDTELNKVTDEWAMHAQMRGLAQLWEQHRLAVVHGVGYPNPNRSHFESMKIWQAASTDKERYDADSGWLGSVLSQSATDRSQTQCFHIGDEAVPIALRGRRCDCISLADGEDLHLQQSSVTELNRTAAQPNALVEYVTRDVSQAYATADNIYSHTTVDSSARYPDTKLGRNLKLVSQLIKSESHARVYYTQQGGYDTHASQLPKHAELLSELSGAVKAFMDDLRASGLEDRVLLICFSEFGRRVKENDSLGTDHGAAGPMFLAGSRLTAGSFGKHPSLTELEEGDLRFSIDFRAIYSSIVSDWLQLPKPASITEFSGPSMFLQPTGASPG